MLKIKLNQIRRLIGENDLEESFQILSGIILMLNDKNIKNTFLGLRKRFNKLEMDKRRRVLTQEAENTRENRLAQDILEFINHLEKVSHTNLKQEINVLSKQIEPKYPNNPRKNLPAKNELRRKIIYISTAIIVLISVLSYLSLRNSKLLSEITSNNVTFIIFVDEPTKDFGNIYTQYLQPIIEDYLSKNSTKNFYNLNLLIYPLDERTEEKKPLLAFQFYPESFQDIHSLRIRNELNIIKKALDNSLENYKNPSQQVRILPSIPLVADKLKNKNPKTENNYTQIIYISDMLELSKGIRTETQLKNGYFSFLENGVNQLNSYELMFAKTQVNDPESWIAQKVLAKWQKSIIPDSQKESISVNVFKPSNILPIPSRGGATFVEVEEFWELIFRQIGISFKIQSLSELKYFRL